MIAIFITIILLLTGINTLVLNMFDLAGMGVTFYVSIPVSVVIGLTGMYFVVEKYLDDDFYFH